MMDLYLKGIVAKPLNLQASIRCGLVMCDAAPLGIILILTTKLFAR